MITFVRGNLYQFKGINSVLYDKNDPHKKIDMINHDEIVLFLEQNCRGHGVFMKLNGVIGTHPAYVYSKWWDEVR